MVGFSDYDVFLSNMIRDDMINRDVAILKLREYYTKLNKELIDEILSSYNIDSEILYNSLKIKK